MERLSPHTTITFRVTSDTKRILRERADVEGGNVSSVLNRLISQAKPKWLTSKTSAALTAPATPNEGQTSHGNRNPTTGRNRA